MLVKSEKMDKQFRSLEKDLELGRGDAYAVPYLMLQYGSKALIPLVKGLKCPTVEMRANCVECLHQLGDPRAVDALIQMFDDIDNEPLSWEITEVLDQLCGWKSLKPIFKALHTGSPRIRVKIAKLLLDYDDETVLLELIKALKDPEPNVFIHVCKAIEAWSIYRSDRDSASSALVACLSDDEPGRRLVAVNALSHSGNFESAFSIINTIRTYPNDAQFHAMAGLALAMISEEYEDEELNREIDELLNTSYFQGKEYFLNYSCGWDKETDLGSNHEISETEESQFAREEKTIIAPESNPESLNILIEQLKDTDSKQKIEAIEKLGERANSEATMNLCHMLSDDSHEVQLAAIKALRKIGDIRATDPFVQLLPQKTCYHREDIAEAMGALGDATAIPVLAEVYKSAWLELRAEIVRSLGRIGGPSVIDPLIIALKDIHPKIRHIAVYKLYDLQHKRAIKAIRQAVCLEKNKNVKAEMEAALSPFEKVKQFKHPIQE